MDITTQTDMETFIRHYITERIAQTNKLISERYSALAELTNPLYAAKELFINPALITMAENAYKLSLKERKNI